MGLPTPKEWAWVIGLWELAHKKTDNTRPKFARIRANFAQTQTHTTQTTLPHRGSSHSFYLLNLLIDKEIGGSLTTAAYTLYRNKYYNPLYERIDNRTNLWTNTTKLLTLLEV